MRRQILFTLMAALAMLLLGDMQPVSAQQSTPSATSVITEVGAQAQTFGILTVAMFLLMIGAFAVTGIILWKWGLPLIQTTSSQSQIIANMHAQTVNAQSQTIASQQVLAESVRSVVELFAPFKAQLTGDFKMMEKAQKDGAAETIQTINGEQNAGRENAVAAINKHTNERFDTQDAKIDGIIKALEDARQKALTKEVLNQAIDPLVLVIDEALKEMRAMQIPADSKAQAAISAITAAQADSASAVENDAKIAVEDKPTQESQ